MAHSTALALDDLPTLRLRTLRRLLAGRPIIALHHAMPIAVARALVLEARLPIAAVVDHGANTLCGTLAWRELRRGPDGGIVADVMDAEYVTIAAESDLAAAKALMEEHGVDRLVVIGARGDLLGIVDANDLRDA